MYDWKKKGDGGLVKEVTREGVTWLSFPALEETGLVAHAFSDVYKRQPLSSCRSTVKRWVFPYSPWERTILR